MQESTVFDHQCSRLKDQTTQSSRDELKEILDIIVVELKKDRRMSNLTLMQKLVATIFSRSIDHRLLSNTNLLDHEIFVILRDLYLNLFRRWRTNQSFDAISADLFSQLAVLFADLCCNAGDSDVEPLKNLLIYEPIIDELRHCLDEITTAGKHVQDPRIKGVNYGLRAIHYLEKGRVEIQSLPMMTALLDSIVQCICSKTFLDLFQHIDQLETLDEGQTLILDTCTDFITWHDAGRYKETTIIMRTALLHTFVTWFDNFVPSFQRLTKPSIKVIGQLCVTLIGGNAHDEDIFPTAIRDGYCRMIDQIYIILNAIMESSIIDDQSIALTKVLTQNLYSLTMTNDLRTYIKSKQMVPLLLKVTNIDEETIQFHVYRILASILTEDDIKTLINPTKTATVFLRFLTNLIDDSSRVPRFQNLLRSLKILIQHDQIKEELTKQDVLPLLLRCATESKFDPIKVRLPALEILLALTFNEEAARQLKQNTHFITTLKTSISTSTEQQLQRVAENLLWKLEIEETAVAQSHNELVMADPSAKKYNIMLSYSHSDKELCYRIYDRLIKDQLRVWIDRDQMHGQTMAVMAEAIEKSEFVFICMSDTYKQSAYCQSEAHYAFERRCHIIPLIMKPNYRPDGWLGILVSGKIYVNFPKLGFDVAYDKLKNEIARFRKEQVISMEPPRSILHDIPQATSIVISHERSITPALSLPKDYPPSIHQWTNDHVRVFLINEQLESLLPVLGSMNGRLLHETYKRCQAHWDLMFQSFKDEVAADNSQKRLTVDTYIRFLDEIQKYIPVTSNQSATVICVLM